MSNKTIITKEKFDELYNPNISKRRYDELINEIDSRVNEILDSLKLAKHIKLDWYCFENGSTEEDNCPGNFDPNTCATHIEFIGPIFFKKHMLVFTESDCAIPTRWLWEEGYLNECEEALFKFNFNEKKAKEEIEQKKKDAELKVKRQVAIESIKKKLTKDELRFVKFK